MDTKLGTESFRSRRDFRIIIIAVGILLFFSVEYYFHVLNNKGWTTLKFPSIEPDRDAFAIDGNGNFWMDGTCSEIIVSAPDGNWKSYTPQNSGLVEGDCVQALAIDREDRVWIGTQYGLSMLEPSGRWTTYNKQNWELLDHFVDAIAIGHDGSVYVISTDSNTQTQLSVLKPDGSWRAISSLPSYDFSAFAVDQQGQLWVGNYGGLASLGSDGKWTRYTSENSGLTEHNGVESLVIDHQGYVWIGIGWGGGLSVRAPDGLWTTYTSENSGLARDWFNQLALDSEGRIWIGNADFGEPLILQTFDPQKTSPANILSAFVSVRALLLWLMMIFIVPLVVTFVRKPAMILVSKTGKAERPKNWFFLWVVWGISSVAGWVIASQHTNSGYSDSDMTVISTWLTFGIQGGGIAGIGQWFVLRLLRVEKANQWALACIFSWFLALPVLLLVSESVLGMVFQNFGPWYGILNYTICALIIGIIQWTFLRRWVHNAEWWIFATALGWPWPFQLAMERAFGEPLLSWPLQIAVWSLYGVISATTFLYLFRQDSGSDAA